MEKKLTRLPSEAVLGGVAAGMSDYFGVDRTIIRVLWVVALLLPIPPTFFWTTIIYIILWVALPEGTPLNTPNNPYDRPPGVDPSGDPRYAGSSPGYSTPGTTGSGIFSNSSDPDRSIKIIGVILLGVGAILLLDELPYWNRIREYIWPAALIIAGAYLLLRQRDKEQYNNDNTPPPPPADPFTPHDPFPPIEPDPVPYRPFDAPAPNNPSIDPDKPADPDGETDPSGDFPKVK